MTLPVRDYRPSDFAFVLDAWKSCLLNTPAYRSADPEHFRNEAERAIGRLVKRGRCRIAYNPADDDHLIGFAAFGDYPGQLWKELHFVYVKRDFRGKGIARALLQGLDIGAYTFVTPTVRPPSKWAFTPRFCIA
jgi:GNAT superfamily N-acetyltransferase